MTDDRVETHVVIDDAGGAGRRGAASRPLPGVVGPAARRCRAQQIVAVGVEERSPVPV